MGLQCDTAPWFPGAPDGFVENMLCDKLTLAPSFIRCEQLTDNGNLVGSHSRAGLFGRSLCILQIAPSSCRGSTSTLIILQLMLFFQDFEKLTQIHHNRRSFRQASRASAGACNLLNPPANSATRMLRLPWLWQHCIRCSYLRVPSVARVPQANRLLSSHASALP